MTTTIVVFSRDRAMQLDAAVRSLFFHCPTAQGVRLAIIYRATNSRYARQYQQLRQEWARLNYVEWVAQQDFRQDVLSAVTQHDLTAAAQLAARGLGRLRRPHGNRLAGWIRLQIPGYIFFLVDDCLFVRDFDFSEATEALKARPTALGYSLRLGRNTTACYPLARTQRLPPFEQIGAHRLSYAWATADADFSYPLEVSSSIYRRADVLPLLYRHPFDNPNRLEALLAVRAIHFKSFRPDLLCFDSSVAFCNPINKVQSEYDNRVQPSGRYSGEALASLFDDGYRIQIGHYSGFVPVACHQEVELEFEQRHG